MPKKIEWDFSSFRKEIQDRIGVEDKNSLYYFHITIESGYYWGDGWRNIKSKYEYESQFEEKMEEIFGRVPKTRDDSSYYEINMDCGFYAHPMEWTGFANMENIEKLLIMAKEMPCVKAYEVKDMELLYPFSYCEYQKLIAENYPQIKKWFAVYDLENQKMPLSMRKSQVGFDFAKQNRLSIRDITDKVTGTLDNHKGVGFDDADVMMVSCLYTAYQAEKKYEKELNMKKFEDCHISKEKDDDEYER